MKKLHEIVAEIESVKEQFKREKKEWDDREKMFYGSIESLSRLYSLALEDTNIDKVQLAESVLYVHGNPYGRTDDVAKFKHPTIAESAIVDIAKGCPHLKKEFFGNKRYDGFYQGTDCSYGMGPRHGSIVDEIGLRSAYRKIDLTDDQKDACIYYLKNYAKITAAKPA